MLCAERHNELDGLIREVRREISNYHIRVLGKIANNSLQTEARSGRLPELKH